MNTYSKYTTNVFLAKCTEKHQKNEVIEVLKEKFAQYNNFYITDTESLSVAQVGKLRKACFDKQVEMKVAKNTLIKKEIWLSIIN